jgi:hypothetical protein
LPILPARLICPHLFALPNSPRWRADADVILVEEVFTFANTAATTASVDISAVSVPISTPGMPFIVTGDNGAKWSLFYPLGEVISIGGDLYRRISLLAFHLREIDPNHRQDARIR